MINKKKKTKQNTGFQTQLQEFILLHHRLLQLEAFASSAWQGWHHLQPGLVFQRAVKFPEKSDWRHLELQMRSSFINWNACSLWVHILSHSNRENRLMNFYVFNQRVFNTLQIDFMETWAPNVLRPGSTLIDSLLLIKSNQVSQFDFCKQTCIVRATCLLLCLDVWFTKESNRHPS